MKGIIILFLILPFLGNSQTLNYEITVNKSAIGNLSVTKKETSNTLQIEIISQVKLKLYSSIDFKYRLDCTYKDKELIFASVTTYLNGNIHTTNKIEKVGEYYTTTKDGHSSKFLNKITYSGALLYFNEPKEIASIFSEFDLIVKPIKRISNNKYQIKNPQNRHLSEYTYKNGILETSTNHHSLITFTLSKK